MNKNRLVNLVTPEDWDEYLTTNNIEFLEVDKVRIILTLWNSERQRSNKKQNLDIDGNISSSPFLETHRPRRSTSASVNYKEDDDDDDDDGTDSSYSKRRKLDESSYEAQTPPTHHHHSTPKIDLLDLIKQFHTDVFKTGFPIAYNRPELTSGEMKNYGAITYSVIRYNGQIYTSPTSFATAAKGSNGGGWERFFVFPPNEPNNCRSLYDIRKMFLSKTR